MILRRLLPLSLLLALPASGETPNTPSYCEIENPPILKSVTVKGLPNFFFRIFPNLDQNIVSFTGSDGRGNHVLNLDTLEDKKAPGTADPVPLWSDDVIIMPGPIFPKYQLKFVALEDIRNLELSAPDIVVDYEMSGVYPSVAQLQNGPDSPGSHFYRVLTALDGVVVRDYKVTKLPASSPKKYLIEFVSRPVRLCPYLNLTLPQISKDGQQFIAFDNKSQTTKIFNVDMFGDPKNPKTCIQLDDFQIATGKGDFAFGNNSKIAFHMSNMYVGSMAQYPADNSHMGIFVIDRSTRNFYSLHSSLAGNAYFPVFKPDLKMAFMETIPGASDYSLSSNQRFKFTLVDAAKILEGSSNVRPFQIPRNFFDSETKVTAKFGVGMLWNLACRNTPPENQARDNSLVSALILDKDKCKSLVEQKWTEFQKRVEEDVKLQQGAINPKVLSQVSKGDLLAACPD
jgi:hypothetical protein